MSLINEKLCACCGQNIEHQGTSFSGKENTICRYGKCRNDFQNIKNRAKKYSIHASTEVKECAKMILKRVETREPIFQLDVQLKFLVKEFKKQKKQELKVKNNTNRIHKL